MENPYETPTVMPQRRESRRELWQRQLTCPHCQHPGVAAGTAYLAHPFLKVRCNRCQRRLKVKLVGEARKRFWQVGLATIMISLAGLTILYLTDPLDVEEIIAWMLPAFWASLEKSLGFDGQMKIVVIAMGLVILAPLLLMLAISIRICLRDITYHSVLIPTDGQRSN